MDEISLGSYEDAPRSLRDLMRKYSNTPQQGTDVLGLLKRVYGEGASNLESVLRGSAAAIPGFAGDIGQGFDIRGLRSLPTTEQILSKIPRATRPTKEGAGFEEVGTYLPLPISPGAVKQGAQAVQRGMKAAAPYAARSAENLAEKYGIPSPVMYVVKPKGGNWLAGHVEMATQPLKVDPEAQAMAALRRAGVNRSDAELREMIQAQPLAPEKTAVNRWVDTKLNKYIRNEMATPEDPIRALAERGILHVDPQQLNYRLDAYGKYPSPGQEFLAKSDAAKVWEGVTDNAIGIGDAGDLVDRRTIERNPWLETVPPETKVYGTAEAERLPYDLGFDHLLDELRAAVDPASTLPQNLRYTLKDLEKVTVPQAVERVSQINAWRAKEAARAEKEGMMANLQAQPRLADENLQLSFVEKPGGTWVDIPETVNDEGMKLCTSIGRAGGWCTQHDWAAKDYGSGVNRLTALVDAEGRPHAQAKITQIGGTDDAMEDVDGLMQVLTASERKKFNNFLGSDEFYGEFEEAVDWLRENMPKAYAKVIESRKSTPPDITELKPVGNSFKSERAQEYAKRDPNYAMKVEQSVLRFLNSGDWGNVKDLHHYDIVDMKSSNSVMDALQSLYGDESGRDILKTYAPALNAAVDATPDAPRFMTLRQLRDFIGPVESTTGFAAGGLVAYDPDEISRIAEEAVQGFAGGGIVKKVVKGLGEFVDKYSAKEADKAQQLEAELMFKRLVEKKAAQSAPTNPPTEKGKAALRDIKNQLRESGKQKFLEPSVEKRRVYHGTAATDIRSFGGDRGSAGHFAYDPEFANEYAESIYSGNKLSAKEEGFDEGAPTVYPAHVSVQNVFDARNPEHRAAIKMHYEPGTSFGYSQLEAAVSKMKQAGFDSYYDFEHLLELTPKSEPTGIAVFDPKRIKSATGNRGTYDITDPDITKAAGGLVKMLSKYLGKETAKEVVKEAPKEQKMLMGVYRGYAGERGAPEEVFATPQRSIADYYAQRRAAELGAEPHAEMLLVDPFAGQQYGLSIPLDKYNREYNFTRARKLKPEDVKDRTPLYAAGGLVNYDPNEIDTIVSQLKEEFHG